MDLKNKRLMILIAACSTIGVVVGGTSGWAESTHCLQATMPTNECVTKSPALETFEGMAVGLIAGATAAIGATFQIKQED